MTLHDYVSASLRASTHIHSHVRVCPPENLESYRKDLLLIINKFVNGFVLHFAAILVMVP